MGKQPSNPDGPPPAYPEQVHLDAGPVPQGSASGLAGASGGPYNQYGGFHNPSHKPDQSHLDPRGAGPPHQYASPAPGGYASPAPGGYGPPGGYYNGYPQQQQQMYYGQPPHGQYPGPGYGPQQGGGYYGGPDRGYYDRRGRQNEGICAAVMAAMACCCCFDLMF